MSFASEGQHVSEVYRERSKAYVTGGEELMHYTGDWYLKYAALNLAG
jgi:hypothetical protein